MRLMVNRVKLFFNFLIDRGRSEMEQKSKKVEAHEDTKKLSFVVLFLSIFVIALFGLAPLA